MFELIYFLLCICTFVGLMMALFEGFDLWNAFWEGFALTFGVCSIVIAMFAGYYFLFAA